MYKIAEEKINEGLSPLARGILAFFAVFFGVVTIATAFSEEEPSAITIGFGAFCIVIALVCVTRGRVRQFLGSAIGVVLFGLAIWYFATEAMSGPVYSGKPGVPSQLKAFFFMQAFGIPGIAYAVKAKFGLGKRSESGEEEILPQEAQEGQEAEECE